MADVATALRTRAGATTAITGARPRLRGILLKRSRSCTCAHVQYLHAGDDSTGRCLVCSALPIIEGAGCFHFQETP